MHFSVLRKFFLLILVSSFVFSSPSSAAINLFNSTEEQKKYPEIPPKKLYDKVWKIIESDYVDQHYNHQDWDIWRHRYDEFLEDRVDAYKAIETMIASLGDRYTRFLDRKEFEEEKESIEAELTGVGIQIGLDKENRVIIIAPIVGTPGAEADLRPNDLIIEIDGQNTSGISIDQAARKIRGPVATEVTLTIQREKEKLKKTITRAVIPIKAIPDGQAKMIFDDIGYVRLSTFISKDTVEELLTALKELKDSKGLIIDLRNNPGGLLNNAMVISDMFLNEGVIVSTVNRNSYVSSFSSRKVVSTNKPLVLLVNSNSASASEIFSGAMRDNDRAAIVGTTTFGKGLVQAINKLGDGSGVNVTIAKYLTPNKTDINRKGIKPDYEVKLEKVDYENSRGPWFFDPNVKFGTRKPEDGQDRQLMKAVEILKEEYASKPIPKEIVDKLVKLDAELEIKRKEAAEKEKDSEGDEAKKK